MEKEEFLRLLPKLIKENDEVKGAILSALSGIVATKDDIKRVIENTNKRFETLITQMNERFEAVDKRFEAVDKRFETLIAQINERFEAVDKRFEAMDKRFETLTAQMNERFEAVDKRFEAMDKRFETLIAQMNERFEAADKRFDALVKEMNERFKLTQEAMELGFKRLNVAIGSLGQRSGKALESTIIEILNDELIKNHLQSSKIHQEYLVDRNGEVFTMNYSTDIDVLIENNKTYLIEVKYHPNISDLFHFLKIAELYEKTKGKYDKLIIICLQIDQETKNYAHQQEIKIITEK